MTTHSTTSVDLADPLYTIEHLAALFHVAADTAWEYTRKPGFPPARQAGKRCLWLPAEVLAWVAALPPQPSAFERRHRTSPEPAQPAAPVRKLKAYQPRAKRAA